LLEGKSVKEVANDLDIHPVMLSRWRREYFQEKDAAFPGQGNPKESDKELQRLRREVVQLREERYILKKRWCSSARKASEISLHPETRQKVQRAAYVSTAARVQERLLRLAKAAA
jgi:transposase